jgi:hypothetical protein
MNSAANIELERGLNLEEEGPAVALLVPLAVGPLALVVRAVEALGNLGADGESNFTAAGRKRAPVKSKGRVSTEDKQKARSAPGVPAHSGQAWRSRAAAICRVFRAHGVEVEVRDLAGQSSGETVVRTGTVEPRRTKPHLARLVRGNAGRCGAGFVPDRRLDRHCRDIESVLRARVSGFAARSSEACSLQRSFAP